MLRLLGIFVVALAGCFSTAVPTTASKDEGGEEQEPFPLKAGGADVKPVPFDGKRAMKFLEAICDIGPRMSATSGMASQIKLITKHFEDLGLKVETQTFQAKQVTRKEAVPMTNLIIRFFPEKDRRVILCSHYDTRPIADQEPDPRKWREKFVSANDGGSGVAFLMELANHMKNLKTNVGVDFVFFDGEEFIFDPDRDRYFFGSEHFAQTYKKNKGKVKYGAAILLDMIGGIDPEFPIEGNSWLRGRTVCEQVWQIAGEQKCKAFRERKGATILDDHIELQKVGIPAIDIIDFDYKHWHRLTDVPSNCSGDSLSQVSKVLSVWLQRLN
jgi:glutaminyl-peptide cyclotransferase